MNTRIWSRLFAICTITVLLSTVALATPVPAGTITVPFANNQGTMSGFFTLDPTTKLLTDWNFQVTASGTFGNFTYTHSDPNQLGGILNNDDGDQVFAFDAFNPTANSGQGATTELDIVIACGGSAKCVTNNANIGTSFQIATGVTPCPPGTLKCISSGEQYVFDLIPARLLGSGFLNTTDPPGGVSFNADPALSGTLFNPNGNPPVPEPASLFLLGTGLVGLVARRLRK